jgi:hypothetical protein
VGSDTLAISAADPTRVPAPGQPGSADNPSSLPSAFVLAGVAHVSRCVSRAGVFGAAERKPASSEAAGASQAPLAAGAFAAMRAGAVRAARLDATPGSGSIVADADADAEAGAGAGTGVADEMTDASTGGSG